MQQYPKVELEIYINDPIKITLGGNLFFTIPRMRKLILKESSEISLFGSLSEERHHIMPSLFLKEDPKTAIGIIDQESVEIYNKRQEKPQNQIQPGMVEVKNTWSPKIRNLTKFEIDNLESN